jgi:hypothetical protein
MTMRILLVVMALGLAQAPSHAIAQAGGTLPKGGYKPGGAKPPSKKSGKAQTKQQSVKCSDSIYLVGEGVGSFSKDGNLLYLLARNKDSGKLPRYTIFKIDPDAGKADPIYSLEQKGEVALMTLNNPVQAVSTVSFLGPCANSYEGTAGSVTISLANKVEKAVQLSGDFALIETHTGRVFSDMKKNAVLEMDAVSFQTKSSSKYRAGERPLFFDPMKRLLVTWHNDKKQRGLVAYFSDQLTPSAALSVPEWDKVLRDRDLFGAYTIQEKANAVVIHEIPEWSGVTAKKDYTLKVLPEIPVRNSSIFVDFQSKFAGFVAATWKDRTKKNKVFLYNYSNGELVGKISPATGDMPGYTAISPNGKWLIVETKDISQKNTTGLKAMRTDTGFVSTIKLGFPK